MKGGLVTRVSKHGVQEIALVMDIASEANACVMPFGVASLVPYWTPPAVISEVHFV
jgi:hypothetical protein